jgi:hypothetical protein
MPLGFAGSVCALLGGARLAGISLSCVVICVSCQVSLSGSSSSRRGEPPSWRDGGMGAMAPLYPKEINSVSALAWDEEYVC